MKLSVGKSIILILVVVLLLAACGGGSSSGPSDEDVETEVDPETGLMINPLQDPGGPFIVEGVINSLTLTPQTSPEFVIKADNGKNYRIRSQSLADTYYDDGEAVTPSLIRQGERVRATVTYDPAKLLYFTDNLLFFRATTE